MPAPSPARLVVASCATDPPELQRAGELLRAGGLVAFPTETVYGLGANAYDEHAIRRLFAVKKRPADNPLIVHLADIAELDRVAASVPADARRLADRWWPGPLTLVLEAAPDLPAVTTGGLRTVAVRVPDHPVALAVLRRAGVPVAAPSANRSGRPSPTTAEHVLADLGHDVDLVLDGGPSSVGVESTVVDVRGGAPVVLREGAVTREALQADRRDDHADSPASPGTRYRHYAPACRVEIVPPDDAAERARSLAAAGARVGLVAPTGVTAPPNVTAVASYADPDGLARVLYAALRHAEACTLEVVVVATVPDEGIGRAVMDRLRRAAAAS